MSLSSSVAVSDQDTAENKEFYRSKRTRALIVDGDHPSVLAVYGKAKSFYSRIDAANGVEAAFRCLSKTKYDAVITDLELHDQNGYELARWVRDKSPDTKVIMMTRHNPAEVERYMSTGIVDHWVFKPSGIDRIVNAFDDIALEYSATS